jgi:quinol-cytochrome oxidoreductase complex cytochrome b subunit
MHCFVPEEFSVLHTYRDERVHLWITALLILLCVIVVVSVVLLVISYTPSAVSAHGGLLPTEAVVYALPQSYFISNLFGG